MALLRKVRSATLVETLVASAIILVVFALASLSLNNVFGNVVMGNDGNFRNHVREIRYRATHEKIPLPYYENTEKWEIAIERQGGAWIMEALFRPSGKITVQKIQGNGE